MKKSLSIATAAAVAGYRSKSSGTGDPYWSNTSLLLSGDGTNGSNSFSDLTNKNIIQSYGNAQINTSVKKYGTGSMYFDGSGDYLTMPANTDFAFGTGDFTIECWVYFSTLNQEYYSALVTTRPSSNLDSMGDIWFGFYKGNERFYYEGGFGYSCNSITSPSVNTWYHVALVRKSSTVTIYVNGVPEASVTDPYSKNNTDFWIGGLPSIYHFNGYIDDFRVTKGIARYTSDFTPPTKAFPTQGI